MATLEAWNLVLFVVAVMLVGFVLVTGMFFSRDGMKPSASAAVCAAVAAVLAYLDGDQGWFVIGICAAVALLAILLTLVCSGGEK